MTTPSSKKIIEKQKKNIMHIYDPIPIVFKKGSGVWIYDTTNKKYLDCLSAYSSVNQGHCNKKIISTLISQINKLNIISGAVYNNISFQYYEYITKVTGFQKVLSLNSGSEAIELAIKIIRKWGYITKNIPKNQAEIIVFSGNYHGRTTTISGFSDILKSSEYFGPYSKGFKIVPYDNIQSLKKQITRNTCGIIIEPIQCENGLKIPAKGFLKKVDTLCKTKNILLCVDEIQTGLGRTGKLFCYQYEKIQPDIVTLGKSLSGGIIPISAVLCNNKTSEIIQPGDHGGTFIDNPLSSAVAKASLKVIISDNLINNSKEMGEYLLKELKKMFRNSKIVKTIRGKGLLIGIELNQDSRKYCEKLWTEGIFCKYTHKTIIRIMPPLTINKKQIDYLLKKLKKCII